jgi:hypothetical protein
MNKITPTDALLLFVVFLLATIVGNLIVAKIVSDQASASLSGNPLVKLLGGGA